MPELICSFCDKKQSEVKQLLTKGRFCICDQCVVLCVKAICAKDADMAAKISLTLFGGRADIPVAEVIDRFPPGTTVANLIATWAAAMVRQNREMELEKKRLKEP